MTLGQNVFHVLVVVSFFGQKIRGGMRQQRCFGGLYFSIFIVFGHLAIGLCCISVQRGTCLSKLALDLGNKGGKGMFEGRGCGGERVFDTPQTLRIELYFCAPHLGGPKVDLNPRPVSTFKRALGLRSTFAPPSTSIIYQ